MRVAVTGAGGRLGTALRAALAQAGRIPADDPAEVLAWDLPEHDLDDLDSAERLVSRDRPSLVIHTAAWTDVDGCARQPDLAMWRNGQATGAMARACVRHRASLIVISTNEVFDGRRTDGLPYRPEDEPNPINAYGASKLAGERLAREAFDALDPQFERLMWEDPNRRPMPEPALAIVRTAWLFGGPGPDFPSKILAAAYMLEPGGILSLVADEIGCPTYASDLAGAIEGLVGRAMVADFSAIAGIHHVVNGGRASRADWAREVLRLARRDVPTKDVPLSTWPRPSTPPAWGVLEPTPLPTGPLRPWRDALAAYMSNRTDQEASR